MIVIKVAEVLEEITQIEAIRMSVFQEEQGVDSSLDFDGFDAGCVQLIALMNNLPVGTARVRFLDNSTAKIERLAVLSSARGLGVGRLIMQKALLVIGSRNVSDVVLHAQVYIKGLHEQLGFHSEGEVFEEAGILHVKMRKKLT